MLRESHRVLRSGGRLVGFVIHSPIGLGAAERERAETQGPSFVNAPSSPTDLARSVGFEVLYQKDVSNGLRTVADALYRARAACEEVLREEEGDRVYEEEQEGKRGMIDGCDAGLLLRSIVVAVKP